MYDVLSDVTLVSSLQIIVNDIEKRLGGPTCHRAYTYIEEPGVIQEMQARLDGALCFFQVRLFEIFRRLNTKFPV